MNLRPSSFLFVLLLVGFVPCLGQQPSGTVTLDNVASTAESPEPEGPRPQGTIVRTANGAQHPDLDKAWAEYDAAVAKVTESIKAAITKQFDAATSNGDLDGAEKWQTTLEKFENAGELPVASETKAAVTAAVADYKKHRAELTKAYEAVVKALTVEKKIADAKMVRNEQNRLARDDASGLDATKPDPPRDRRQPEENRKTAPIPRGITLAPWNEIRGREFTTQQVPLKTTAKSTSSHPGNFGPNNAVDGDVVTEFAFLGAKGELVVDFGGGVECSGLLLRARPKEEDMCTRGFVKIDDSAPFAVENFGGGRVIVIGLGRKQKVRRVIFHSEQGHFNPGVSEVLLVP